MASGTAGNGLAKMPSPTPRRSCYQTWFEDWWMWELLAVLSSIGLAAGLCVLLTKYDGKPIPTFGSFDNSGITLSTVVSLLVTLAVALSLFAISEGLGQLKWIWYSRGISRPITDIAAYDNASRGTWGSFMLLWRLGASMPVGTLGALLVVVNLAIVPLAQQSVGTVSQSVPDIGNQGAKAPWAYNYKDFDVSGLVPNGERVSYGAIGQGMKGAVLNGLFSSPNGVVANVQPSCSTGNCTFDDYYSLAVCASRVDVTSHLQKQGDTEHCLPGGFCLDTPGIPVPTGSQDEADPNQPSICLVNVTSAAPNDLNSGDDMSDAVEGDPLNYTSVAFPTHNNSLADFYFIYLNETDSVVAMEVLFEWCIPKFSTNVSAGVATTIQHPDPFFDFSVNISDDDTNDLLVGEMNGTQYQITLFNHFSLQRWLQLLLSGSVFSNSSVSSFGSRDVVEAMLDPLNLTNLWVQPGLSESVGAWNLSDFDRIFSNTATSMTNFVRSTWESRTTLDQGDNKAVVNSRHINGTVLAQRSVVVVSWGWLAAPLGFVFATTVFMLLVVIFGHQRPPVWKTSTLAITRCLDPDLQRALGPLTAGSHLAKGAEGSLVSLVYEEGGWRLVSHSPPSEYSGILPEGVPPEKGPVMNYQMQPMPSSPDSYQHENHPVRHDYDANRMSTSPIVR